MKKHRLTTLLINTCGLTLLSALAAQAQDTRFYLRGDVGGQWTMNTSLKQFFGEPLAPGAKVEFEPGARLGITGGYLVTDWFAAEAQTGVMANKIKSVTGASRVDDVFFSNVPFLINARFQCPSRCRFTPYVGGGLGFSASVIDADHLDLGGTSMHGSESATTFAYQAFGGLRYRLNAHMGLSLEYHYFATTDPTWKADNTAGTATDRIRFGGAETHAVSVAFEYKF